jgi:hypothetical protein
MCLAVCLSQMEILVPEIPICMSLMVIGLMQMPLERIVGTCNLPATILTLSFQLWNATDTSVECKA